MKWVTRERPKIDRIACPWLIARFIDESPEFLFGVRAAGGRCRATRPGAIPYDVPGVELTHVGERCSFDAFLERLSTRTDPALRQLADIVRGADTSRLDLTPQSAGLYALSLGLSLNFSDDHEMLRHGLVMYDAFYAWCRDGRVAQLAAEDELSSSGPIRVAKYDLPSKQVRPGLGRRTCAGGRNERIPIH